MALETMYEGLPFSPQTTLTSAIGASEQVIPVADVSVFPDAPNYATIAGNDGDGETILYTAKTGSALSGCTRGVEGTAKRWDAGEIISRNWTAADHAALINNVNELNAKTDELPAANVQFSDGQTFQQKYNAGQLTGPSGKPGTDGKSAYQSAVEEGYTGTELEFYAALVTLEDAPFLPLSGGKMTGNLDGNYIKGEWLQATASNHLSGAATKICVQDKDGWVYHRTAAEIRSDIGVPAAIQSAIGDAIAASY